MTKPGRKYSFHGEFTSRLDAETKSNLLPGSFITHIDVPAPNQQRTKRYYAVVTRRKG